MQEPHLGGAGPLLRREHLGRVDEAGPHITGDLDVDPQEPGQRRHRPQRTEPAVGGGRAADTHDHPASTRLDGSREQLSGSRSRRVEGVVPLAPTRERQPRRPRHLDHGHTVAQSPFGHDRHAQRTGHLGAPIRAAQRLEGALAAVGQRLLDARAAARRHRRRDRRGCGPGRRRTTELVGTGQHAHRAMVPGRSPVRTTGTADAGTVTRCRRRSCWSRTGGPSPSAASATTSWLAAARAGWCRASPRWWPTATRSGWPPR